MPQDVSVFHIWDGDARTEINMVYLSKRGDVMTIDEGMNCYSDGARPVGAPTESEDPYYIPLKSSSVCIK